MPHPSQPSQLSHASASAVTLALSTLDALLHPIFHASFGCEPYTESAQQPAFAAALANFTRAMEAGFKVQGTLKGEERVEARAAEARRMLRAVRVDFE